MMRGLLATLALLMAVPVLAAEPQPVAEADVVRNGDNWTADYSLKADAPAWVFTDSILPRESKTSFRADSWTVETPGVRLERHGWYDVLVANSGNVPRKVRIRFTPYVKDIEASYDAALAFSDGSVALYDGKFKVVPMPSVGEIDAAPIDSDKLPGIDRPTLVSFRDRRGDLLALGQRRETIALPDVGTYVLFGRIKVDERPAIATIVDPQLPGWLKQYLVAETPKILASYAKALGPAPGNRPTLMVSWNGPTAGVTSMGGSVLTDMIVMTFEGDGVVKENRDLANNARGFIAHEAAHYWLGQAISYDNPQQGWITEGGADLLSIRAVAANDPAYDAKARLQGALDRCAGFLAKGGIGTANERGDHKAYYDCGAIIGLTAEKASGGNFASFVKALIRRAGADGVVTRAEWLALLEDRAPGRGLPDAIGKLLDGKPANPNAALADLLHRADVPFTRTGEGVPQL
jgi:hypothetical protein